MAASLPLEDVRKVFRLVAECRERGDDALRWREHLLLESTRLLEARVGMSGEIPVVPFDEYPGPPMVQTGWASDEEARRCHETFARTQSTNALSVRAAEQLGPVTTCIRDELVSDEEWYDLPEVKSVLRQSNIDGTIQSRRLCEKLAGWADGLVVFYPWRQKPTVRERDLLSLLHDEIAPLVGGPLAARGEPAPSDLTPRKRQVLECLLLGAGDKQIAASLYLARSTVSEYVSEIMRHYGVESRTELMAAFLERYRRPQE